jgi:hypothetical protein
LLLPTESRRIDISSEQRFRIQLYAWFVSIDEDRCKFEWLPSIMKSIGGGG